MTQKEITRLRVINQTIDKVITIREAAELLGLSERQVIRLKGGVRDHGLAFIIHKNRGRKPQHTLPDEIRMKIVELKQSKYQEANFNHFVELLEEHEGIKVSYSSVHRILAGIKSPKKHRRRKSHHRRKRKPQKGMLVQIDASPHEWIIDGKSSSLHVEPENPQPAFRSLVPGIELDHILCIKEERTIIEDSAFSSKGKYYQLVSNGKKAMAMPKDKLTALSSSKIGIKASYAGVVYDLVLEELPKKNALKVSEKQPQKRNPVKPAADHPWRQTPKKKPNFVYEETDREIIEMLNQLFNSTRAWA